MKKIILLSAHAQNGKDTYAEFLKKELQLRGQRVAITHFAKHIKRILIDYYGWDGVTKSDYYRGLLQYLGTDKIRVALNKPHFHVNRTCEEIEIISEDFDYVIIADARFPNEIYYTKASFPDMVDDIRINRMGFESPLTDEQQNHPSETALDYFKFSRYVMNNRLKGLRDDAEKYADRLVYGDE